MQYVRKTILYLDKSGNQNAFKFSNPFKMAFLTEMPACKQLHQKMDYIEFNG